MMTEDGINIRIYDKSGTASVDVYENGITGHKEISLPDLADCFERSHKQESIRFYGLLPQGLVSYSGNSLEKYVVLRCPAQKISYTYENQTYEHFPMPELIFGIHLNKDNMVLKTYLRVLPQGPLSLDSPLYYYPFSNVYANGQICMGKNEALFYDKPQALENYPAYVLGLQNNDDLFTNMHNRKSLGHRELLDLLATKSTKYYYHHILVPVPRQTLKDFCTIVK